MDAQRALREAVKEMTGAQARERADFEELLLTVAQTGKKMRRALLLAPAVSKTESSENNNKSKKRLRRRECESDEEGDDDDDDEPIEMGRSNARSKFAKRLMVLQRDLEAAAGELRGVAA